MDEPQKTGDIAGALLTLLLLTLLVAAADSEMKRNPLPAPVPPTLWQRSRRLAARLSAALSPAIRPPAFKEVP